MEPKHKDHCDHGLGCYVGSFEHGERPSDPVMTYDVYVHDKSSFGQEVCLRFGDKAAEYLAPGTLWQCIRLASQEDVYWKALQLLVAQGAIAWTPNEAAVPEPIERSFTVSVWQIRESELAIQAASYEDAAKKANTMISEQNSGKATHFTTWTAKPIEFGIAASSEYAFVEDDDTEDENEDED